ncbi:hypothetical protein CVT26_008429 [Gymnopilus dilepis]|uniref:Uncharacterized protein n=1 Tax=Gymnopilus dilepis TaxID=231916 RepID=A0A409YFW0_9AGAR|nr:hypothetical protein CVT26_008429 [Gymnopilus dilepis]
MLLTNPLCCAGISSSNTAVRDWFSCMDMRRSASWRCCLRTGEHEDKFDPFFKCDRCGSLTNSVLQIQSVQKLVLDFEILAQYQTRRISTYLTSCRRLPHPNTIEGTSSPRTRGTPKPRLSYACQILDSCRLQIQSKYKDDRFQNPNTAADPMPLACRMLSAGTTFPGGIIPVEVRSSSFRLWVRTRAKISSVLWGGLQR